MSAAAGAGDFDPAHSETAVVVLVDNLLVGRGVETGPTAMGVELFFRSEEFLSAAGAVIRAFVLVESILAGEGAFGAFLA